MGSKGSYRQNLSDSLSTWILQGSRKEPQAQLCAARSCTRRPVSFFQGEHVYSISPFCKRPAERAQVGEGIDWKAFTVVDGVLTRLARNSVEENSPSRLPAACQSIGALSQPRSPGTRRRKPEPAQPPGCEDLCLCCHYLPRQLMERELRWGRCAVSCKVLTMCFDVLSKCTYTSR